jgi:uncharacterized protein (DUF305 family)
MERAQRKRRWAALVSGHSRAEAGRDSALFRLRWQDGAMSATAEPPTEIPTDAPEPPATSGGVRGAFGPLTAGRAIVLAVAFAFLAATVGYFVGHRSADADPLSATDVGFMQDMIFHHDQANRMSLILLGKDDVRPSLHGYATEIIMDQRQQQGIMNATLDRYGHASTPGATSMGWMGHSSVPPEQMDGMASERKIDGLTKASGDRAEELWIAMMSAHHLGGIEMAAVEARRGHDRTTRNLARSMVLNQRGEIIDLARYRTSNHLGIPKGFTDPLRDPRLNPASATAN